MTPLRKLTLIVLGALTAVLIVSQFVMARLILAGGAPSIRTAHNHSGHLMAVVSLLYVVLSLVTIAGLPARPRDR